MSVEFLHVGMPITTKKPGMNYLEGMKVWVSNPEENEYKIEYLKFEEGTPFPEILHKNPHVAYKVDDLDKYLKEADRVVFDPAEIGPGTRIAFVVKDDTLIELYEQK